MRLIRNRLDLPSDYDLSISSILSDIIRRIILVIDDIVNKEKFVYCLNVKDLVEHVLKLAKSLPDLGKIESIDIIEAGNTCYNKAMQHDNDACKQMALSFKTLLDELFMQ